MLFITNFEYYSCFSIDAVKYCKKRRVWDRESVVRAVKAIRGKEIGLLKASKMFSVPQAALEDYVNNKGKDAEAIVTMRMGP
jgi:hypothetical protein